MTDIDKIRSERDRFMAFAFAWADLVVETNGTEIVYLSGAVDPLLGRPAAALIGQPLKCLFSPGDEMLIEEIGALLREHGRVAELPVRLSFNGSRFAKAQMTGHALAVGGSERLFLAIRTLIRRPDVANGDIDRDDRSGLLKGEHFHGLAATKIKAMARDGEQADMALIALDGLERLRDHIPPQTYETLMTAIGAALRTASLDGDSAAVVDDGKFSLLLRKGQNIDKMRGDIAHLVAALDPRGEVEVVAAALEVGDAEDISEEDLAKGLLYSLQKFQVTEGALNLKRLTDDMRPIVDQTVKQIVQFRDLVKTRGFDVAVQPIISIRDGSIHHFEALCRFHTQGKDASPYKTINFAEETGQIHEFDLAMATKVVEWLGNFPRNNSQYNVAVNVSGFSVGKPDYVARLFDLLEKNTWTQGRLSFEITESSRMSNLEEANAFIQRLRRAGFHVCLDDFGAGAASFQYLASLDVDVVKLDGSAVKNAEKAAKGRAFLSALCELCRRLDVDTVAEMVDTPETLSFVRDCGCDYVQGWLFGKPSTDIGEFFPYQNKDLFRRR